MGMFNRLFGGLKKRKPNPMQIRNYLMGEASRLYKDWPTGADLSADQEIYTYLSSIRTRARHLFKNNDYAKRFAGLLKSNVVGANGVKLQVRSKKENGELDETDNNYIEEGWNDWSKKENCTVDGKLSLVDVEKLFIKTVAFDGEGIIRKIKGFPYNKYNFALQFIEPDLLDHHLNKTLQNGNKIRLGIEFDEWKRPVNYYFKRNRNSSIFGEQISMYDQHEVIPADQIIHEFVAERIGQSRGISWLHTAGRRLHMLRGYEEGELVSSRAAANKMGFFTSEAGDEYVGDEDEADEPTETPVMNAEPGTLEELPGGMNFVQWDPTHPTTAFEAFVLAVLRGAASGLNVSYYSLANDLRSVSYSSIRQGALEDRDEWKSLQGWMIEHFLADIYPEWLVMAITSGILKLPMRKLYKFMNIHWQGRRWQWVDPLKEIKAYKSAIKGGLVAPQEIIADLGGDFRDVIALIKEAAKAVEDLPLDMFSEKSETEGKGNVQK